MVVSPIVEPAQTLATESPVLFGVLAIVAVVATISVVRFAVSLAIRLAVIAAILLGAFMAVGYLG
ncbi:hypothetical protein Halru_2115 [Halovivax ruber XH-70]|uniref:Uncharacterized protein n=1 Tax=Halovivax ruber (strain DSM 18193 / JCM 13892 / XH-70) TaxID=797302 RepID=L0IEQ5_HALRX|nr:hypothetical protein [Halovivax ruber]AGB16706.1 hypothetical protein Halru_2115 [Halovivax ruber XH-70]